jgi:hypothetical protein
VPLSCSVLSLTWWRSGWVPNSDLIDLDPDTVIEGKSDKMRKDLQAAYDLAAENNDLRFYKEVLQRYQEEQLEKQRQRAAKAATPKSKKAKVVTDDDEDVEMADAADEDDSTPPPKKSAKKRKAEDSVEVGRSPSLIVAVRDSNVFQPPQRAESVKKTKIKLTTNANRKSLTAAESTPKAPKPVADETKAAKPKTKKKEEKSESEPVVPKEPELTQEEKHTRKEVGFTPPAITAGHSTDAIYHYRRRCSSSDTSSKRDFLPGIKSPRKRR